jgi:hypothetical protein
MSGKGVQTRNFWSVVRVMRSNFPLRSRTYWENEIPSSNGGLGSASQAMKVHVQTSEKASSVFL